MASISDSFYKVYYCSKPYYGKPDTIAKVSLKITLTLRSLCDLSDYVIWPPGKLNRHRDFRAIFESLNLWLWEQCISKIHWDWQLQVDRVVGPHGICCHFCEPLFTKSSLLPPDLQNMWWASYSFWAFEDLMGVCWDQGTGYIFVIGVPVTVDKSL